MYAQKTELNNEYEDALNKAQEMNVELVKSRLTLDSLENTLANKKTEIDSLNKNINEYKLDLKAMKEIKRDSMNIMQESIYGLLASPWWTREPRADKNNVPITKRFIPQTKEDVIFYRRELNKKNYDN